MRKNLSNFLSEHCRLSPRTIVFCLGLVGINAAASADTITVPSNCEYGRVVLPGNVDSGYVNEEDVNMFLNAALSNDGQSDPNSNAPEFTNSNGEVDYSIVNQNSSEYETEANFITKIINWVASYDYLRIEGPDFIAQGESKTFKGNLWNQYAYVKFNTSEDGYVGRDKSNFEANAYKSLNFNETYGMGLVWVQRDTLCSMKNVWIQKRPIVSQGSLLITRDVSSAKDDNKARVTVNYKFDQYSKVRLDETKPKVNFTWINDNAQATGGKTIIVDEYAGTLTADLENIAGGYIKFYVSIDDGNYGTTKLIGGHQFKNNKNTENDSRPCPSCFTNL